MTKFKKLFYLSILFLLICQVSCSKKQRSKIAEVPNVYIEKSNDGYQLIRNGHPFIVKGACGKSFFKELKQAGANTVRIYDTVNLKQTLDSAQLFELAVIVDIPMPRFARPDTIFANSRTMEKLYLRIEQFVKTHKSHPALLYWMLGNEIDYPDLPGDRNITRNFNALIDMIHEEDKNHPISTAIGGFNRSQVLSVQTLSSSIDFISINIFGELNTFEERKRTFALLWDGPYIFSELGINGPWEADNTFWGAPIEQTSTKKAEQFKKRHTDFVETIDDGRFLGSLFFYWGQKQERTYTWFSSFAENGQKAQMAFEFENAWSTEKPDYEGPIIDYVLLNGKGANESIVLRPGAKASASVLLPEIQRKRQYVMKWDIRRENWNYGLDEVEINPHEIKGLTISQKKTGLQFKTPQKEGPYRLYVTLEEANGYVATTNVPFYILDPENE